MKLAYLDPPYSRYFHELAAQLAATCNGDTVALLSSPAYRLYCAGDRAIVWEPVAAAPLYQMPDEFAQATWARPADARFRVAFSGAVDWFKQRFREEGIELCLVFSDARPFSVAARLAAGELGIVCLFFERGAFRLSTASLSTLGLNARFSLNTAQRLTEIEGGPPEEPMHRRATEPWLRLRFARFIVHNALACLREPGRGRLQHKRYALGPYFRLALTQWWSEHHHARSGDNTPARPGKPLLIVPLQLETDSQLVLHSPFTGNQAFVDFIAAEARQVMPDALVLVKRHPMDTQHYRLPAGARWTGGNLGRYFGADAIVVCVNSNVGFEAAVRGTRVVCFGPSFYSDAPNVVRATKAEFGRQLASVAQQGSDVDAGRSLRAAVLRWYQSPGDVWAFTPQDIEQTVQIVLQHYRAAMSDRGWLAAAQPTLSDGATPASGCARA